MTFPDIVRTKSGPLHRILKRATQNVVMRRRLPSEFGNRQIYLSLRDSLRPLSSTAKPIEPGSLDHARRFVKPGMVVWDVGANLGAFTFSAGHMVEEAGEIVAIEPNAFKQSLLRRTHKANPDLPVSLVEAEISDQTNMAERYRAARQSAVRHPHQAVHDVQADKTCTGMVTLSLDWLAERRAAPDLIRCHAKTSESSILFGAQTLLREKRPLLIMQVLPENGGDCTQVLHGYDYTLFRADEPIKAGRELKRVGHAGEIVAVPVEQVAAWYET